MFRVKKADILLFSAITLFFVGSKVIFDGIFITSTIVIDEEFHLVLGRAYCNYNFSTWDPKVTTLPGLYLLSSALLGGFSLCSTYWLRLTNLIFSVVNIILFYCILNKTNNEKNKWKNAFSAINIGLLPPLYFFGHFYYTDVTSLTMILSLMLFAQTGHHYLASIFGFLSIVFRQTNVIWVGMVFGCYIIKALNESNTGITFQELFQLLNISERKFYKSVRRLSWNVWLNVASYASVLFSFIMFVYMNGSIVVGDKTAHQATINLPQIFYFSVFSLFFGWPFFIPEMFNFVKAVIKYWKYALFAVIISLVIVYKNTLVHPYMLADNRHYIFYIWNRFYGNYAIFRYCMVPVYLFALFVIGTKLLNTKDVSFMALFIPCTIIVLVTQRLLEVRYFFIPYLLFRFQLKNVTVESLIYEMASHLFINAITLFIFFTKIIDWPEYDYPQRLIW